MHWTLCRAPERNGWDTAITATIFGKYLENVELKIFSKDIRWVSESSKNFWGASVFWRKKDQWLFALLETLWRVVWVSCEFGVEFVEGRPGDNAYHTFIYLFFLIPWGHLYNHLILWGIFRFKPDLWRLPIRNSKPMLPSVPWRSGVECSCCHHGLVVLLKRKAGLISGCFTECGPRIYTKLVASKNHWV